MVVGLDLSLPMLRTAVRLAREERMSNLLFLHGSALDLPLADDRFDAVNCCGALHLFPDVSRALFEIHRVLVPGGCRFTVAAFRRGEGTISNSINVLRRRFTGVDTFTSGDLGKTNAGRGFRRRGTSPHRTCLADGAWGEARVVGSRRIERSDELAHQLKVAVERRGPVHRTLRIEARDYAGRFT